MLITSTLKPSVLNYSLKQYHPPNCRTFRKNHKEIITQTVQAQNNIVLYEKITATNDSSYATATQNVGEELNIEYGD